MSYRTKLLGRAASAVAPNPLGDSGGLSDPLLSKDDSNDSSEEEEEDDPFSSVGVVIGAVLLGAAGIAASAAAMVSGPGLIAVYVAGGFCVANSGAVVKNQYDLSKGKSYKDGINSLREEANRLRDQVDVLHEAINDLQSEADLMQGLEQQLSEIARQQGVNANEIVMLVRENEEILTKQKANLKQRFISEITKAFISSEFLSGDMKIDLKNLPVLLLRLQIQLNTHGMHLDTNKFTAMVQQDNDVSSILKKCGDMFSLDEQRKTSSQPMDMVTVDEQYSKGSVDVARGKSPQLVEKKLEHRNTVVRDVKRGLSMKGIAMKIDSDEESSVISGYDREDVSVRARPKERSTMYEQDEYGQGSKSKIAGKFKTAARVGKLMGGKKDEEYDHGQEAPSQQRGLTKTKLKSAAMMASATASTSRDPRMSPGSSARNLKAGVDTMLKARSVDKVLRSFKKTSSQGDDAASLSSKGSSGKGSRRTSSADVSQTSKRSERIRDRSAEKALASFRMSSGRYGDSDSISSSGVRKSQSQPRRRSTSGASGGTSAFESGSSGRKSQSQPKRRQGGTPLSRSFSSASGGTGASASSPGKQAMTKRTSSVGESSTHSQRSASSGRIRRKSMTGGGVTPPRSQGGRRRSHNRDGSF